MVHDTNVRHHQNIRKRVHKKFEKYPHNNRFKRVIDKLVYIAGFFGLAMTIPQIFKIWIEQNASGISVISWISYMIVGFVMITYSIAHKEKPLIIIYSIWEIFYLFIIVGTLIYG
ncbi:hypothetical protein GOV12_03165 [Candidatus Pacearchaeota archaeon]|nr:hypothetical protein [Candidatus Pacearchaeota archaeon]